ncbi:unnamed protein product [Rotaria sordida]|uniref:Uncharacterized protein n=1 Tax=Rotaria sordida TaxID=392033 RepID=A0A815F3D0_9BILA|nr:unnamed protein product [Rotaria sordida]CAF1584131.1 unnamed protein product [Rotaria sordida]
MNREQQTIAIIQHDAQPRTKKNRDQAQQTVKLNQLDAQTQTRTALIRTTLARGPFGHTLVLPPLSEHNPCDNIIARSLLVIAHNNTIIRLIWMVTLTSMKSIREYEVYKYQQGIAAT